MNKKATKPFTIREILVIKILFILIHMLGGKSYDGGIDSEVSKLVVELQKQIEAWEE